jgi:aldehyde:ferredoxin oxidoreductase
VTSVLRVDLTTATTSVEARSDDDWDSGLGFGVTGCAPRPSYLLVFPTMVYVLDADDLWAMDTAEVIAVLVARHPGARVAVGAEDRNCKAVVLV